MDRLMRLTQSLGAVQSGGNAADTTLLEQKLSDVRADLNTLIEASEVRIEKALSRMNSVVFDREIVYIKEIQTWTAASRMGLKLQA